MSNPSLVLVLGAGASAEVGLPVGGELKERLAEVLDIRYEHGIQVASRGNSTVDEAYRQLTARADNRNAALNAYLRAGWRIRDAMPQAISIDHFVDVHRNDELIARCAKLAIAWCILEAENESEIYVQPTNVNNQIDFKTVRGTWYARFFNLLTENCQASQLEGRLADVAVVTFNYDRCIEHYLHYALQNFYKIEPQAAARILSMLQVHHPYGSVGPLEWQDAGSGHRFGDVPNAKKLVSLSENLRTFSEGVDAGESQIESIRSLLLGAKRLVFLGFAFHKLNLDLLFPGSASEERLGKVYGTAYGISKADVSEIKEELMRSAGISEILLRNDLLCSALFSEYWRSLSLV